MKRAFHLVLAVALVAWSGAGAGEDSKEVRKQRAEAQKERQAMRTERNRKVNDATRAFREYTQSQKAESRQEIQALETEFELRKVDLNAEHDRRVATAEAEFQKKLAGLFTQPGTEFDEQAIEKFQADGRAYADEMFALRRQSAEALHRARIEHEEAKNRALTARDRDAMREAAALGLTDEYPPILAKPIGGSLTPQEDRWNERETKEAENLAARNHRTLAEFRNGEALRSWKIKNLEEDFALEWQEKAELHALDSQQVIFNTVFLQAAQSGKPMDQRKLTNQMAELAKQRQHVRIDYQSRRQKLRILREAERKEILAR